MRSFEDRNGLSWTVDINVSTVRRVRQMTGVNLLDTKSGGFGDLAQDPIKLVDVIYVVCKDEADKRDVSSESFGAAMVGDAINAAWIALIEDLADFFPNPAVREALRRVVMEIKSADKTLTERVQEKVTGLVATAMSQAEKEIELLLTN